MVPSGTGFQTIKSTLHNQFLSFQFGSKFRASDDVNLFSGLSIEKGCCNVRGTYFQSLHSSDCKCQPHCIHPNDSRIDIFCWWCSHMASCNESCLPSPIMLTIEDDLIWDTLVLSHIVVFRDASEDFVVVYGFQLFSSGFFP